MGSSRGWFHNYAYAIFVKTLIRIAKFTRFCVPPSLWTVVAAELAGAVAFAHIGFFRPSTASVLSLGPGNENCLNRTSAAKRLV